MKLGTITYLRILLTTRCNMACRFCHHEGAPCGGGDIDESILLDAIGKMYGFGFRKFKLMGGEPILYPNLLSVIRKIRGRIGASDLSMISNGTADATRYEELLSSGMDRLNISIHGWSPECFVANTGCKIEICDRIRKTLSFLSERRLIGKLNYVVKKGVNEDDFFELLDYAGKNELVVDALNLLDPGGNSVAEDYSYSMADMERLIRARCAVRTSSEMLNKWSLPSKRLWLANGAQVNLKVSMMNNVDAFDACAACRVKKVCVEGIKAVRLTSAGILQPCLMRTDNILNLNEHSSVSDIAAYLEAL